jgi:hypothetical protein
MLDLNILKPNRPKEEKNSILQKKILCILEGEFELRYIIEVFRLYGYEKDCFELSEKLIKVAWCDKVAKNINIVYKKGSLCKFDGGGTCKGSAVPTPAIKAFEMYAKDLSIFDSILVFFDGDRDKNNEVENYFIDKFKTLGITNFLLVSMPCFESTLIDFCTCGKCREVMNHIEEERLPCKKYKDNFSKLECFEGAKHLVDNLTINKIDTLKEKTSKLNSVNTIIKNYLGKSC